MVQEELKMGLDHPSYYVPKSKKNKTKEAEMKTMIFILLLGFTISSIGDTTYIDDGQGQTIACNRIGDTTFCN